MFVLFYVLFFLLLHIVEHSEEIISVINEPHLPAENTLSCSQDDLPAGRNKREDLTGVEGNGNKTSEQSENLKYRLRRVLTPNPEDAVLPNLYGNRVAIEILPDTLPQTPPNASLNLSKASSSRDLKILASNQNNTGTDANMKSQSDIDLRISGDFNDDYVMEDPNFIFERRDSKRLAKKDFGGRIVEGLFVESPLIKDEYSVGKSGLRKIALSQSLQNMDSPTGEDSHVPGENSSSLCVTQDKQDTVSKFEERLNYTNFNVSAAVERISQASNIPNKVVTSVDIHNEERDSDSENQPENGNYQPVPKVRTKPLTKVCSTPNSFDNQHFKSPPCPKPRRKLQSLSECGTNIHSNNSKDIEGVEFPRGPVLLLDPIALQHQTSSRGAPNINPDGSVEIRQGWSLIRPWW
jgi:hypothetical protein